MADLIDIPCGDSTIPAYLSLPADGGGPGVVVVPEWWGVEDGVKDIADRLAHEGFVALIPDLYHGEVAPYEDLEQAERLMQSMSPERAHRDLDAAVDFLAGHKAVTGEQMGAFGAGLGGLLVMLLANNRPDKIGAVVTLYGYPYGDIEPADWSPLKAAVRGFMAEYDEYFPPEGAQAIEGKLREMGKDITMNVYERARHGFMSPNAAFGSRDEDLGLNVWLAVLVFFFETLG
jgi:carboxymethylenebutenolidase